MARPIRIQFHGAIYHVMSRTVGSRQRHQEPLFHDDKDHQRFLKRLGEGVETYGVRLYLYCLMGNHYHLLVETPHANLSRFIQWLTTAYTIYFNLRHQRHGHLFAGRFKAKLVSGDEYLLKLSRYIHQNPVRSPGWDNRPIQERSDQMGRFRWSSYAGYIGVRQQLPFVDEGPVLALMGERASRRRRAYREYVETGLAERDDELEDVLQLPGVAIGDEDFRLWAEKLRGKTIMTRKLEEDISFRRAIAPLRPEFVLDEVAKAFTLRSEDLRSRKRGSPERLVAAKCLVKFAGQTQRQAAEHLGLTTGAAVSARLKRLREIEAEDKTLRRRLTRLENQLANQQQKIKEASQRETN